MSFSSNVKSELCRGEVEKGCCALAEAHGVLLYANTFSADCIRIVTECRDFAIRLPRLFRKALGVNFDQLPEPDAAGKLTCAITDPEKIHRVFAQCGFSAHSSLALHVNLALLEKDCCRRAFLRGAFLAGGSVTDPEKRYHLELSTTHLKVSRETETLMREMEMAPKQTERKGSLVVYFKQSDAIEDFLALIGAPVNAMAVMQAKIEKDWRNEANRKTNCDSANVDKTVAAAQEQLAALRKLERAALPLPEKLKETARLRQAHPEATLSELAELHDPPLSKSAINHRLRKLMALAAQTEET
ncbi:MAG: DNA-binding protein WhiA [Oscillospiraceae bacterium]|nr:DNA-binding protein WhiA [Oscillospiraceae bacterium]